MIFTAEDGTKVQVAGFVRYSQNNPVGAVYFGSNFKYQIVDDELIAYYVIDHQIHELIATDLVRLLHYALSHTKGTWLQAAEEVMNWVVARATLVVHNEAEEAFLRGWKR